jgi:hypothetical protein
MRFRSLRGWVNTVTNIYFIPLFMPPKIWNRAADCEKQFNNANYDAPGHPTALKDLRKNVRVVFLPPNTTSLLQQIDQGII